MSFRPPRFTLPRVAMPRVTPPRLRPGRITPARFRLPMRKRTTVKVGAFTLAAPGIGLPGGRLPALDTTDLLRQAREQPDAPVDATAEAAASALVDPEDFVEPEAPPPDILPVANVPWPVRRRGPATLVERRSRLEAAARTVAGVHGAVEFQTNTVAVVNHGSIVARTIKRAFWLLTLPPRIAAQAIAWLVMPRGKGKLKRTVVVVDRRGNVVVYRV